MKVSILIPVYNGSNYLEAAIKSALSQTYHDVEVIVINDGSTDAGKTAAIARSFRNHIVYIEQENKGVAGAMNAGFSRMSGDIFTWLSHDDLHLPEKVEAQVAYYRQLGEPDAVLFSDYYLIDENGLIVHESKLPFDAYVANPMLPVMRCQLNGCTIFVPARIIKAFGPFDEKLRYVQDYELWNEILSQHEFFLQPKPLVKYRVHAGQDTNRPEAIEEADALWIRIAESRSEVERVQLSGSTKRFYGEMASFLLVTPYKKAVEFLGARAAQAVDETLVSVVLTFRDDLGGVITAAESVLGQTHKQLELILVDNDSHDDRSALTTLISSDERIRSIRLGSVRESAARMRGIRASLGNYIAFIEPGDVFDPTKVAVQLADMQEAGVLFSHSRAHSLESNASAATLDVDREPILRSTVMLHRCLIASGILSSDPHNEWAYWDVLARGSTTRRLESALSFLL